MQVIVGSVDGNRIWGKELEEQLRLVQWSPDGKLILFVKGDREIDVYDYNGSKVMAMPVHGWGSVSSRRVMRWAGCWRAWTWR